jgi:ribosome biogenesis GTPase A
MQNYLLKGMLRLFYPIGSNVGKSNAINALCFQKRREFGVNFKNGRQNKKYKCLQCRYEKVDDRFVMT